MEHTDAPLTPPRDPRVAPPPMTNAEIRQWIEACNHEPARQVLRSIVGLREEKFDIIPIGEIRHLKGKINTQAAEIASLRTALKPFAQTGWMTNDTEHTARTIVAHMHPESRYEIILSSDDFRRANTAYEQTAGEKP